MTSHPAKDDEGLVGAAPALAVGGKPPIVGRPLFLPDAFANVMEEGDGIDRTGLAPDFEQLDLRAAFKHLDLRNDALGQARHFRETRLGKPQPLAQVNERAHEHPVGRAVEGQTVSRVGLAHANQSFPKFHLSQFHLIR